MQPYENRATSEAKYIIKHKCTIRECALYSGVSKSTVHIDVSIRLKKINYHLYTKVQKILKYNFSVKHLRGGEASRLHKLNKTIS